MGELNLKIIQIGVNKKLEKQNQSQQQLQSLTSNYIRIENTPYDKEPPINNMFEGNKHWYVGKRKELNTWGLTSRHYGCWLAHKQALQLGFCENEHFLVCEGDCKILDIDLFKMRLQEAITTLDNSNHPLVTFSEPNLLTTTTFSNQVSKHLWEFDNIINAHCYLVNKNSKNIFDWMFNNVGWREYDFWLLYGFNYINKKILCQKENLAWVFDGPSSIDIGNYE